MSLIFIPGMVCLLIQALYWRLIFSRAADDIRPSSKPDEESPFLSVVICFHKKWDKTPEVLQCMEQQTYQNFEVILVNDGPVALAPETLQSQVLSKSHFQYIEHVKDSPGKKGALSAGIEAANGNWLALTDIDCRPDPSWLQTMTSFLPSQPTILLGFSPYNSGPGFLNFVIRQETLLTAFQYMGWARAGHSYMGVGRNMVYHKSIYEEVTFESHQHIPTGDDDLFVNEAAHTYPVDICNERPGFVYSTPVSSWKKWYRQKTRHKSGGKYYSRASKIRLSIFLLALVLEKIILTYLLFVRIDLFLIFVGLKIIFTIGSMRKLYRKYDHTSGFWKMYIYEWFHVLYLILVAPYIFIVTKQQWD